MLDACILNFKWGKCRILQSNLIDSQYLCVCESCTKRLCQSVLSICWISILPEFPLCFTTQILFTWVFAALLGLFQLPIMQDWCFRYGCGSVKGQIEI